jgi:hypothetical protein
LGQPPFNLEGSHPSSLQRLTPRDQGRIRGSSAAHADPNPTAMRELRTVSLAQLFCRHDCF